MLIERQVSIALGMISVALAAPQVVGLTHDAGRTAGGALIAGVLLGTLAVMMGVAVAQSSDVRALRSLGVALWTALALALSAGAGLAVLHAHSVGGRVLFGGAAAFALAIPGWLLARASLG